MNTAQLKAKLTEVFLDAFNHGNLSALDLVCAPSIEDDLVAFQGEMNGTHTGPYMGRPPSGNPVLIVGMNMERLENGKIVEHWSYPDKLAALQQIGAIPACCNSLAWRPSRGRDKLARLSINYQRKRR